MIGFSEVMRWNPHNGTRVLRARSLLTQTRGPVSTHQGSGGPLQARKEALTMNLALGLPSLQICEKYWCVV